MTVLAIDQGTTSTRGVLLSGDGALTPVASLSHRQHYPGPGQVEHDPEELLAHLRACIAAGAERAPLTAIGIDNQGESCLAWDAATGAALSPVIVWQDDRTAETIARMRREGLEDMVRHRAGLPLDPYFSASKLAWILREVPAARACLEQGRLRLGTTDAFFRDRLTGQFETDVTTASRTALMNLATCDWDDELCRLFGVPRAALPRITPSTGPLGTITANGRPVPLTASLVDQQAALYGHGCRTPGAAKITFGTGAFALALTDRLPDTADTAVLPTVAWQKAGEPPRYALDGGVYDASAAVNWARGLGLFSEFSEIETFAHPCAAQRGLVFVPALSGLACPHWNRAARGTWMGLAHATTRSDLMQALLEGIAFRMAEVIEALARRTALGAPISVDGGLSANGWFCQFLSDALGRTLRVSDLPDLTALGTATLAAEAAGIAVAPATTGRLYRPRDLPPGARATFQRAREAAEDFGGIPA